MRFHVLHLFCDGVLSETRAFAHSSDAHVAKWRELERVGVSVVDGEVVDINGSTWSAAIEAVDVEGDN